MSTTRTSKTPSTEKAGKHKNTKGKTPASETSQPHSPVPQSAAPVFALPAAVTIEHIEKVAADLRALRLGKGTVLTIDAAQTDIITTPGIQLLTALSATLRGQEGKLLIVRPQENFVQACNALGLASQLTMGGI